MRYAKVGRAASLKERHVQQYEWVDNVLRGATQDADVEDWVTPELAESPSRADPAPQRHGSSTNAQTTMRSSLTLGLVKSILYRRAGSSCKKLLSTLLIRELREK